MNKALEKDLTKSILRWAALGVFAIGLITHAFSTMLFFDRLSDSARTRLAHAVEISANSTAEFLRSSAAVIWQVTSRTRAQKLLAALNNAQIDPDEYRTQSERILGDALSRSDHLRGIVRLNLNNTPVAAVGETIPRKFWPYRDAYDETVVVNGPFTLRNVVRMTVSAPILDNQGNRLGTDIGLFSLDQMAELLGTGNAPGKKDWGMDIYLVAAHEAELNFFTSAWNGVDPAAAMDPIVPVKPETLINQSENVSTLLNLNDGIQPIGQHVFAAQTLLDSGWRVLGRQSVQTLYGGLYQDITLTTAVTLLLAAAGSVALFLLVRRFTARLLAQMGGLRADVASSETKYRELIDGSIQGIIIHDNFRPLLVNKAWADIHGYGVDEVMGLDSVLPLIARGHRKPIQSFNKARLDGKPVPGRSEYQAINKDRDLVWVENLTKKIEWAGKKALQSTIIDITERKHQERRDASRREELEGLVARRTVELRQQNQDLERALQREREYNAVLDQFVSMASHEFRTPLTIIDSAARRIERKADSIEPKDVAQRTQKIRNAVQRMLILIESVLSSASMGAGKLKVEVQPFGLRELAETTCQRQQEVSPTHRINAKLDALPERFVGDPNLLDQVFSNLLSNAVKYAPDSPEIDVAGVTRGKNVSFSVSDHGVGIPAEEQAKLFDKFFRASTSTGIAGTGIGLNLVAQIVELHGGRIEVQSKEGQGSTFTVLLPIRTMEDYPQIPSKPAVEKSAA